MLGGVFIVAGVVVVKLGEPSPRAADGVRARGLATAAG
jgi:hypothetical protein